MIMKTKICDRCKKEVAEITCDICGCDLCDNCKCNKKITGFGSELTTIHTCIKEEFEWEGGNCD